MFAPTCICHPLTSPLPHMLSSSSLLIPPPSSSFHLVPQKPHIQAAVPAVWISGTWRAVRGHGWVPIGTSKGSEGEGCSGRGDANPWEPDFGAGGSNPESHICSDPLTLGDGYVQSSVSRYCRKGENIGGGYMNFDSIGDAIITVFISATLEGWVDVMYRLQDTWGNSIVVVPYFILMVLFVSSFTFELTLAVIVGKYEEITNEQEIALKKVKSKILASLDLTDQMYEDFLKSVEHSKKHS